MQICLMHLEMILKVICGTLYNMEWLKAAGGTNNLMCMHIKIDMQISKKRLEIICVHIICITLNMEKQKEEMAQIKIIQKYRFR